MCVRKREREREKRETSFESASERKRIKYEPLIERAREAGYSATFLSVEDGSRGIASFQVLKDILKLQPSDFSKLLKNVIETVIKGSHQIWCSRNRQT